MSILGNAHNLRSIVRVETKQKISVARRPSQLEDKLQIHNVTMETIQKERLSTVTVIYKAVALP